MVTMRHEVICNKLSGPATDSEEQLPLCVQQATCIKLEHGVVSVHDFSKDKNQLMNIVG